MLSQGLLLGNCRHSGLEGLYEFHSPTPSFHCLHPPVSPHFPQVVLLLLYTEERSNREHLNLLLPKYSHPCTLTDALCPSSDVDGVNPSFCAQDPLPPPSSCIDYSPHLQLLPCYCLSLTHIQVS